MFEFEAYSKDSAGTVKKESVSVSEKDGILAIYADSISRKFFDTDEAVTVKIVLPGDISEGLAIREESPYWTKPDFLFNPGEVVAGTQIVLFKKKKKRGQNLLKKLKKK